jgi:hypothetical protein
LSIFAPFSSFSFFFSFLDNSHENTLGVAPLLPGRLHVYHDWDSNIEKDNYLENGTVKREENGEDKRMSLLIHTENFLNQVPVNNILELKLYDSSHIVNTGSKQKMYPSRSSSSASVNSIVCSKDVIDKEKLIVEKGEILGGVVKIRCVRNDVDDEEDDKRHQITSNPKIPVLTRKFDYNFPERAEKIKTESRKWLKKKNGDVNNSPVWIEITDQIPDWGTLVDFSSNISPYKVEDSTRLTWRLGFENEEMREGEKKKDVYINKKEIVIQYAYKRFVNMHKEKRW